MVEFTPLFHNGARDSIIADGETITATQETLLWQRERLYNGSTGGSIIAAENQERAPRNCIAVACETPSWQQENVRHIGRLYPTSRKRAYITAARERLCA